MAAPDPPRLRSTDFLPTHFDGQLLDFELATAHFLSFTDYLEAHRLAEPRDAAQILNVVSLFKRTLTGTARLWIEGKIFVGLQGLKNDFLARFSPTHSTFANVKLFDNLQYTVGDSAEQHLSKIRLAATRIGYGNDQVRNRFLQSLPAKCQAAVVMAAPEDATADVLANHMQRYLDLSPDDTKPKEVSFSAVSIEPLPVSPPTIDPTLEKLDKLTEQLQVLTMQTTPPPPVHPRPRSPSPHPHRGRNFQRNSQRHFNRNRSYTRSHSRGHRSQSPYRGPYNGQSNRQDNYQRRTIFCDYCRGPGHVWRICEVRRRDMENSRHRPNFQGSQYNPLHDDYTQYNSVQDTVPTPVFEDPYWEAPQHHAAPARGVSQGHQNRNF